MPLSALRSPVVAAQVANAPQDAFPFGRTVVNPSKIPPSVKQTPLPDIAKTRRREKEIRGIRRFQPLAEVHP